MMSRSMNSGLRELVGKTITGVLIKDGGPGPCSQLFIVCSDNTYYEFFSNCVIEGSSHMIPGDMDEVKTSVQEGELTCGVVDTIQGSRPNWAR